MNVKNILNNIVTSICMHDYVSSSYHIHVVSILDFHLCSIFFIQVLEPSSILRHVIRTTTINNPTELFSNTKANGNKMIFGLMVIHLFINNISLLSHTPLSWKILSWAILSCFRHFSTYHST